MNYGIRVFDNPSDINAVEWDCLLLAQSHPTPFMRHAYLNALHQSGSAQPETGWHPHFITLWYDNELRAACPLYIKDHSYGEYVFDWSWARAYEQHQLAYYPKALIAVPFTPVPGSRLLAKDEHSKLALIETIRSWSEGLALSSWHVLFGSEADSQACLSNRWMLRQSVQFHWLAGPWRDFEAFLAGLNQEKRKKIRQERRKVADAGVTFVALRGDAITRNDWDFFYQCYERTYLEHGNAPYLSRAFFHAMERDMPKHWLLFVASDEQGPMACSLIGLSDTGPTPQTAYGRYWGALKRVDCLHFEACYYQPLAWCIANGVQRFEGGAQGEHKMARALMPVVTHSAHGIRDERFAQAIGDFLKREQIGVENYIEHLGARTPFRQKPDAKMEI